MLAVLGATTRIVIDFAVIDSGTPAYTCDAALCEDCTHKGPPMFFCDTTHRKDSEVNLDDFCPVCRAGGFESSSQPIQPMHEDAAALIRSERHAQLRRIQMRRNVQ